MYRRPKFLEVLLGIRQKMSREADYDVDLFTEMTRGGNFPALESELSLGDLPDDDRQVVGKADKNRKLS